MEGVPVFKDPADTKLETFKVLFSLMGPDMQTVVASRAMSDPCDLGSKLDS